MPIEREVLLLRKVHDCFKNFRFQKKIALISILSSIVPLIVLTFVGVSIIRAFIQQQEKVLTPIISKVSAIS